MYVCLCHAVTVTQITQAVDQGHVSLTDVKKQLGVGSQCGKCTQMATQIIQARLETTPKYYEVA